jgi:hypothetical protein
MKRFVYPTTALPGSLPAERVPIQFLSYAEGECHVMQLDNNNPAPVFTVEMSGCNAYVLRHNADAVEPVFIHCNGNAMASRIYAAGARPDSPGEMAKAATADLIFAKFHRKGFVRHVAHRRYVCMRALPFD